MAEGMLLHGQCAPLGLMASRLLGGWIVAISQHGTAFIVSPLLSRAAVPVFLQTCTFSFSVSGVGVGGQGGVCRSGCERCAAPALGLSLFSLQLWPE